MSNDKTTSRNQLIPLIKFTLLSCSKETRETKKFDTDYFDICANYVASSCATPDEIDFIPGTYKHLTGMTINIISDRLKVAGCGSVSWVLRTIRRRILNLLLNKSLHIPGLPIRLIWPQQVAKQKLHIGDEFYAEKD